LNGSPVRRWHYRVLATWQKGYGSYYYLPREPEENLSLMAETSYRLSCNGWTVRGAVGLDSGKLRGDNMGIQVSVVKTGLLNFRKEQ